MTKRPSHLRLVETTGETSVPPERKVTVGKRSSREGEQLSLDLDGKHGEKQVFLVAMDSIHGRVFSELVLNVRPKVVLDMRHAIRFDLHGTSRSQVFSRFLEVNAFYSKASLPWHEFDAIDFMTERNSLSLRLHHEIFERIEDIIMILLQTSIHARYLRSYLNRKLSENAGVDWRIEEVV